MARHAEPCGQSKAGVSPGKDGWADWFPWDSVSKPFWCDSKLRLEGGDLTGSLIYVRVITELILEAVRFFLTGLASAHFPWLPVTLEQSH